MEKVIKRVVVFASGNGTNADRIMSYYKERNDVSVVALFTDKPSCGAAERARNHNVNVVSFKQNELNNGSVLNELNKLNPDLIVLAGFLKLLPADIIKSYEGRIINIHPALLPKYGGKGLYGKFVHEAILKSGDKKTGITIHLVNEEYDKGQILFQKKCEVLKDDTAKTIAARVQQLEHEYYPKIIDKLLSGGNDQ